MRNLLLLLTLFAAWGIGLGHAQITRQLPASGKLGQLVGQSQPFPLLQINEKLVRLAPGGRIYDQNNRTILHTFLPEHAYVLFVEDMNGDVSLVYLLRPEELELLLRPR